MKSILRLSTVTILAIFLLSSCVKVNVTPESPVTGSWVMNSAAEGDSYGWSPFYTGLENGVFTMYSNGSATYEDADVSMTGSWYITSVSGGYFDANGNYYNGVHNALQLKLNDPYTHSSINLNFDNADFYGNSFTATYFNGDLIERYNFVRY
ncbi:hypothetical protein I5907_10570 [Panacibacter sp. DH6]|uniref:Lipocalin-like domain-containing protein n=1 Tax=Panacibacter microcysteis TaxID=2793269 RepID=A0A931EAD7_9BACT|nr:hypothetical protein [Panacibacter microcysteis]MBG9376681.1 hypothetical protein [Panacibacter microcysteis]